MATNLRPVDLREADGEEPDAEKDQRQSELRERVQEAARGIGEVRQDEVG
jgi:hypothetical protein